ncbi:MAG: hypothetical protein LUH23_05525 [Oscillospiraceae bacterium]|nr:hypothetical protein [Oscillospiraceae bacterium]
MDQLKKEALRKGLKTVRKVVTVVGAFAGLAYLVSLSDDDESSNDEVLFVGDDTSDGVEMKCAHCGNTDENSLFDEKEEIYCSKCHHRTLKSTGEDDLVECPFCHRMRDRKAMYCRWCNDSAWQPSTQEEFEETDRILKDMGF